MDDKRYVLITPARNEEEHINETIQSVLSQTLLPLKWVIVDDGSTDETGQIASKYAERYDFIELLTVKDREKRDFTSQVYAVEVGYKHIENLEYDYLGMLDADISLPARYYEDVLREMSKYPRLGIAGGIVLDVYNGRLSTVRIGSADHHVAGGVQLFRLECYKDIGGYRPLRHGGQDVVAEVMARMHDWNVRSFPQIRAYHNKPNGGGNTWVLKARYLDGVRNYNIGTHPIYQLARSLRRVFYKPYILGEIASSAGYLLPWIRKENIQVSEEFRSYFGKEQMSRLWERLKFPKRNNFRASHGTPLRDRLEEAFVKSSSTVYKGLKRLSEETTSDHLEYMKDNSNAIDYKIARSAYVGNTINYEGARVLDFGSGCGFLSCFLAATGAEYVIGVEIDESRRKTALYMAENIFETKNVDFVQSIGSLEKESFDAVILINVISHVRDLPMVLTELANLLKPHGILFIEDNNNFGSFVVRRKLKRHIWPGQKWDGEKVYYPIRLEYIRSIHPGLPEQELQSLARDTYGLTYVEIERFLRYQIEKSRFPYNTDVLKKYAPVDPNTGMYHENSFRSEDVTGILFNTGLVPVRVYPKYIFDYKRNRIVSWVFKTFPKLSLRLAPAFEIVAIKK